MSENLAAGMNGIPSAKGVPRVTPTDHPALGLYEFPEPKLLKITSAWTTVPQSRQNSIRAILASEQIVRTIYTTVPLVVKGLLALWKLAAFDRLYRPKIASDKSPSINRPAQIGITVDKSIHE